MFVPIVLQVGEEAIAILPGVEKQFGVDHIKAVKGKVLDIKKINGENSITMTYKDYSYNGGTGQPGLGQSPSLKTKRIKIFDYRIVKFTFGGVMQTNPQFDIPRIEKEENVKLDPNFVNWV